MLYMLKYEKENMNIMRKKVDAIRKRIKWKL